MFSTSSAPVDHHQHPVISTRPRLPSARATHEQPPPSRPTGLAPRRLGTHSPLFYVKSIFPSVFPAPSPPPSGFSIGECLDDLIGSYRGPTPRVDGRAPLNDSRPIVLEDVDRKASRTNSTRLTPGTTEATPSRGRRRFFRAAAAWLPPVRHARRRAFLVCPHGGGSSCSALRRFVSSLGYVEELTFLRPNRRTEGASHLREARWRSALGGLSRQGDHEAACLSAGVVDEKMAILLEVDDEPLV